MIKHAELNVLTLEKGIISKLYMRIKLCKGTSKYKDSNMIRKNLLG